MRRCLSVLVLFCLLVAPTWAINVDQVIKHFEDSQKWVKSAMCSFKVTKKASDSKISDLYDFVSDKTYDYEAMVINGAEYLNGANGPMGTLMSTIGDGVLAVVHKLATDDHKKLFKPTWLGYHTPGDKRVSNWFCLIMGNHVKTYLTRVDQRSKLDEIGADPLVMNILDKNLYKFDVAKDKGDRITLRVTPRPQALSNVKEALVELAKIAIGGEETWYATKITGTLTTGATGVTEFGGHQVAVAPIGTYICYDAKGEQLGNTPVTGISTALRQSVTAGQKIFIFPTYIKSTTYQNSSEVREYEVSLTTTINRLHINPSVETMAQYITNQRMGTLEKISKKVVAGHGSN